MLQSLDEVLDNRAFMGFETEKTVALGLGFGAEAGNEVILDMMNAYTSMKFINEDGSLNLRPSPGIQTEVMKKYGLNSEGKEQVVGDGCHIYPKSVFNPYDLNTGLIKVTPDTISIHHYIATWATKSNHRNNKIYQILYRIGGEKLAKSIRKLARKIKTRRY